ncbi:TonB family protein [Opitutaceae bacterium TAV1]|nr:TonB family protein [Opitutaceae bacterium TAV1]
MNSRSPIAFTLSALLHVAVVLVAVFIGWNAASQKPEEAPKIFEVVDGPGDDYNATEAPRLGDPGGIEFDKPPPLPPTPEPPAPEPVAPPPQAPAPPAVVPLTPAPPEPIPAPVPIKPADKPTIVTPAAKQPKSADKPAPKPAAAATPEPRKTVSYTEFQQANPGATRTPANRASQAPAAGRPAVTPRKIDAKGFRDGLADGTGTTSRGAGGNVLSRAEQDAMDSYFAWVTQQIRGAHEKPVGLSDSLSADVSFMLSAGGTVSQIRVTRSSGNAEFDRSVESALRRVRLRPRPDSKSDTVSLTLRMIEER